MPASVHLHCWFTYSNTMFVLLPLSFFCSFFFFPLNFFPSNFRADSGLNTSVVASIGPLFVDRFSLLVDVCEKKGMFGCR